MRLALAILMLLCLPLRGAVYYMATYGSDSNDGLSTNAANAWVSLNKARTTMAAGDTLWIRGGTYDVGTTYQYFPYTVKGTAASPVVVSNYPGEVPVFANGAGSVPPLTFLNTAWVKIYGLTVSNNVLKCAYFWTGVTNCELAYCTLGPTATNWSQSGPSCLSMGDDCYSNYIHDCTMQKAWNWQHLAGSSPAVEDPGGPTNQIERGDVCTFGPGTWAQHANASNLIANVFYRNHIYGGGHSAFNPQGCMYSLFLSNRVHNEGWIQWDSYGQLGGHRASGGWSDGCVYDGNDFGYAGNPIANDGAEGAGLFGPNNIFRRNIVHHNEGAGLAFYSKLDASFNWFVTNNHCYNNTFAHNGLGQLRQTNLWHSVDATYTAGMKTNLNPCAIFFAGSTNSVLVNNIIAFNNANTALSQTTNGVEFRATTTSSEANAMKTNWFNNLTGDPKFQADTNDLYHFDHYTGNPNSADAAYQFALQASSPCIDAGTWLTTATSASSGTALPVADPFYFFAGLTAAGTAFPGDTIKLQSGGSATVTAIDYATKTLTLGSSLTWTNGEGIALAYSGAAPDMGAYEYAGASSPGQSTVGTANVRTLVIRGQ